MAKFHQFIEALNALHNNWMGFAIIIIGTILACCHESNIGTDLIIGGFAIINSSVKGATTGSTTTVTTEVAKT